MQPGPLMDDGSGSLGLVRAGGGIAEHAHLIELGEVMARARAGDHLVQKLVAKG